MVAKRVVTFQKTVLDFYKKHGRHYLPWRKTRDPYKILVSEVMLQQTQVDRVIPYYKKFLKEFPTVRALARAPLSGVLRSWQGLGYNRRAKMLHSAAKKVITYDNFPCTYSELISLPGVGDYTARAVRVFAFNESEVLLETNIRTVYIHHFFPKKKKVSDSELLPYMIIGGKSPREWYAALMDYGAYLKKTVPNPSRRSAHHTKQKPFKGSNREIRGAIIRQLIQGSCSLKKLQLLKFPRLRVTQQLSSLQAEGIVGRNRSGLFILAD